MSDNAVLDLMTVYKNRKRKNNGRNSQMSLTTSQKKDIRKALMEILEDNDCILVQVNEKLEEDEISWYVKSIDAESHYPEEDDDEFNDLREEVNDYIQDLMKTAIAKIK
ncbi:hypothetical protein M0R36_11155 [bacterium]|jgi:uncharacterized membrane protein YheB (UPF0754 family)|nr:hypothetical protein [bacterium]